MKRILLLSCTIFLLAIDALAQSGMAPPPSAWQRYTVKNEEFSIALPTVPAMTTNKWTDYGLAMRQRTQRNLGVYADGVVYMIFSDDEDPKGALKGSLERLIPRQGWDPASEQALSCDGFTGKQYTSTHPLGGTVQVFATKKHFYRFQAFGAPATDPRVQQFFSSLILRNKPESIEVTDGPGTPFEPIDGSANIPTENVFTGKGVDRKVMVLMKPEPEYTEAARQSQTTGTIVIKAVFSANGSVQNITVVSGLPNGLTGKAIEALHKIKFIPAAKDGKFVSMWMQLEYNFNLY